MIGARGQEGVDPVLFLTDRDAVGGRVAGPAAGGVDGLGDGLGGAAAEIACTS
jgi:hypothetical protein